MTVNEVCKFCGKSVDSMKNPFSENAFVDHMIQEHIGTTEAVLLKFIIEENKK
jgi:hypothetical protein